MDHSPAEKDGSRLLGKFRSQKDKSQLSAIKINSSNMNSPNVGSPDSTSTITPARKIFFSSKYNGDIPSFFDAVADGSDLASKYSATKNKDQNYNDINNDNYVPYVDYNNEYGNQTPGSTRSSKSVASLQKGVLFSNDVYHNDTNEDDIQYFHRQISLLNEKLDNANNEKNELTSMYNTLRDEINNNNNTNQWEEEKQQLLVTIEELKKTMAKIQQNLKLEEEKVSIISHDLSKKNNIIAEQNKDLIKYNDKFREMEILNNEITNINSESEQHWNDERNDLLRNIEHLNSSLALVSNSNTLMNEQISIDNRKNENSITFIDQIEELKLKISERDNEIIDLKEVVDDLNSELTVNIEEVKNLKLEKESYIKKQGETQEITSFNELADSKLQIMLKNIMVERDNLLEENNRLANIICDKDEEIIAKDEEIALSDEVINEFQNQLEETKKQMSNKLAEKNRIEKSLNSSRLEQSMDISGIISDNTAEKEEIRELNLIIKQKDSQLLQQVSEFETLQDSLSEIKENNFVLNQQNIGLKELVDNLTIQLEKIQIDSDKNMNDSLNNIKRNEIELDLRSELLNITNERDELLVNLDRIQIRLTMKTQKTDELEQELDRLKNEVDSRIKDMQSLNGNNDTKINETESKLADAEREIYSLKELVELLEIKGVEIDVSLQEKDNELQLIESELFIERDLTSNLRSLLSKVSEKETTTQDFVSELKQENEQNDTEINNLVKELNQTKIINDNYSLEINELKKQIELLEEDNIDNVNIRQSVESEIALLKNQMTSMEGDGYSQVDQLNERIRNILNDKNNLEIILKEHETIISGLKNDILLNKESMIEISELISKYNNTIFEQEFLFSTKINNMMQLYDNRLDSAHQLIHEIKSIYWSPHGDYDGEFMTRDELENRLEEVENALKDALQTLEEEAVEKYDVMNKLRDSQRESNILERSLIEARYEHETMEKTREEIEIATEARLHERLDAAEKRAIEMSNNGAKAFARSTRTIAYLEGESLRLKSLVDHFRIVNVKLSGDLKAAHEESSRAKSLDHRIQSIMQEDILLHERIKYLETNASKKDMEILLAQRRFQELEDNKSEEFDFELLQLKNKNKDYTDKYELISKELEENRYDMKVMKDKYEFNMKILQDKLNLTIGELNSNAIETESNVVTLQNLQSIIKEKDDIYVEMDSQLNLLKSESERNNDEYNRKTNNLQEELQEKNSYIIEIDELIIKLKSNITELEASNLLKDEVITSTVSKHANVGDEIRLSRIQLEKYESEMSSLTNNITTTNAKLNEAIDEVSVYKDLYNDLKNNSHKQVLRKLAEADDNIKLYKNEIQGKERDYNKIQSDFAELKQEYKITESKLNTLQEEFVQLQTNESIINSKNKIIITENTQLISQRDSFSEKLFIAASEIIELNDIIASKSQELEVLMLKINDFEENELLEEKTASDIDVVMTDLVEKMKHISNHIIQVVTSSNTASNITNINDIFTTVATTSTIHTTSRVHHLQDTFEHLKSNLDSVMEYLTSLEKSLSSNSSDIKDINEKFTNLQQELLMSTTNNEEYLAKINIYSEDIINYKKEINSLNIEKNDNLKLIEDNALFIHDTLIANLFYNLTEAVSRVNTMIDDDIDIDNLTLDNNSTTNSPVKSTNYMSNITSSSSDISLAFSKSERIINSLCTVIEKFYGNINSKKILIERLENRIIELDSNLEMEIKNGKTIKIKLQDEINENNNELININSDLNATKNEILKLNALLTEFTNNNIDLESELKITSEINEELRSSQNEAETLCMDFRARIRNLTLENENKIDEITILSDQIDHLRKKTIADSLLLESNTTNLNRIKSEKDASDNVRRSLESELERSRIELSSLRAKSIEQNEENKSSFELEKLLTALTMTLDHLNTNHVVKGSSNEFIKTSPNKEINISIRVEEIVKRLSEFRNWSRNELKTRKNMEEKIYNYEEEINKSNIKLDDNMKIIKQQLLIISDKDIEIKNKNSENNDLSNEILKKQDDIIKLRNDNNKIILSLEEQKKLKLKMNSDYITKDNESNKYKLELENQHSTILKLQDQVKSLKSKLSESQIEIDNKTDQLKITKANNSKLSSSLEVLEECFEKEKIERNSLKTRLIDNELSSSLSNGLLNEKSNLEHTIKLLNEKLITISDEKNSKERDLESILRKSVVLENFIDALEKDKLELANEINDLKKSLISSKETIEKICNQRNFINDNNVNEEIILYKDTIEKYEENLKKLLEEKNLLNSNIIAIKKTCNEKENQRQTEYNLRSKLEEEFNKIKGQFEGVIHDLKASNEFSSNFKVEGKKAKKQIQEAVIHIRELINIVRSDAYNVGVDLLSPDSKSNKQISIEHTNSSNHGSSLIESLGIVELSNSLDTLKEVIIWLRDNNNNSNHISNTHSNNNITNAAIRISKLESEKNRLESEILTIESNNDVDIKRLGEEVQRLQLQLSESRQELSTNGRHLINNTGQVAVLEAAILKEKQDKEFALLEITQLNEKFVNLNNELLSQKSKSMQSIGHTQATIANELENFERTKADYNNIKQELKASNHHRHILKETIEQIEKQLKTQVDVNSELRFHLNRNNIETIDDSEINEEETLRRHTVRYRARSLALEELVATYRLSILALYADGTTYGAAQFGKYTTASSTNSVADAHGSGWIEREISIIKSSYEEEIRLLERENADIRVKLSQNSIYIVELRKRFEESMKSVYRPGKNQNNDILIDQLSQLSASLEKSEAHIESIQNELTHEKSQNRKRNSSLVEEIMRALQARDNAMQHVKRMEIQMKQAGIENIAVYQALKSEMHAIQETSGRVNEENVTQKKAISSLLRGLVETDHELHEAERRAVKKNKEKELKLNNNTDHHSKDRDIEKERLRSIERIHELKTQMLERHSPSKSIYSTLSTTPSKYGSNGTYISTSPSIHINTPVFDNSNSKDILVSSITSSISNKDTHEINNNNNNNNTQKSNNSSSHRVRSASSSRKSAVTDNNNSNLNVPLLGQFHSTPIRRKNH